MKAIRSHNRPHNKRNLFANTCPLCESENLFHLESISTQRLNALYAKIGVYNALQSGTMDYFECKCCALRFFNPLEVGSENFYLALQRFSWYYMEDKAEFRTALNWIEDNDNVLDVGAGKAVFSSYFKNRENYTGLEFNDAAIQKALASNINLLKESVEQHSTCNPEKYDAVVAFQVLEHVASPASFVESCIHCLKPGGRLILSVPSQDGFNKLASNHLLDMPPHHVTHWSEKALERLADIFRLQCLAIQHESVASYHYNWAKSLVISSWVKNKIGINHRLIEMRPMVSCIEKVSTKLSKYLNLDLSKLKGHTVVAVYEKL